MPQDHRRSREEFPLAEAQRLQAEGQTIRAVADAIGWSFAHTRRQLIASVEQSPAHANGTPSTPTALERTIVMGEPVSTPPEYPSTPAHDVLVQRVDTHDQRLDVLKAFMQAMQRHPMYQ
jgi:hypothetical protein